MSIAQPRSADTALAGLRCPGATNMNAGTSRVERRAWAVALLVETGSILSSSLDLRTTMSQVAQLMVPDLADVCVIDLCDSESSISELAVAASRPRPGRRPRSASSRLSSGPERGAPRRAGDPRGPAGAADRDERGVVVIARPGLRARAVHDREPLPIRGRGPPRRPRTRLRRAEHPAPGRQRALRRGGSAARLRAREAGHAGDRQRAAVRRGPGRRAASGGRAAEPGRGDHRRRRAPGARCSPTRLRSTSSGSSPRRSLHGRGRARSWSASSCSTSPVVSSTWTRCRRGGCSAAKTPRRCWSGTSCGPPARSAGSWCERLRSWTRKTAAWPYAANVFENVTQVKRAQLAEAFMAQASRVLASSMDYNETLKRIARLAASELAEWCAVDVLGERGELERVAVHHADPEMLALAERLDRDYRPSLEEKFGVPEVIRTGSARDLQRRHGRRAGDVRARRGASAAAGGHGRARCDHRAPGRAGAHARGDHAGLLPPGAATDRRGPGHRCQARPPRRHRRRKRPSLHREEPHRPGAPTCAAAGLAAGDARLRGRRLLPSRRAS